MCSLCCLTSLFEVFVLKPSKFIIQTTSRQKHVSWVPVTFAEINYYPHISLTPETSIRDHPSNVRSASRNKRTPNWSAAGEIFEICTVFKGKNVMLFKVISAPLQFGENQDINKRPQNFWNLKNSN